jgi:hypothetical protein
VVFEVGNVAMRLGTPLFMLCDLRMLTVVIGEQLGLGDLALRRILNHTKPNPDVFFQHFVELNDAYSSFLNRCRYLNIEIHTKFIHEKYHSVISNVFRVSWMRLYWLEL